MDMRFNSFRQFRKSKYGKRISLLLIIMSLSLLFSYKHVIALGDDKKGIQLEGVPPGAKLTATLDNKETDPPLMLIVNQEVLVFLRESEGQLVPAPAEGVKYGEIFVVEAKFTQSQAERIFFVELNWEGASRPYDARLERADDTGTLYRSRKLRAAFYIEPRVELAVDAGSSNND